MNDEQRNKLIGSNIQKYRKQSGMTQEKLAEALGVTAGHMTAIENGYTGISLPKLIEIMELFNISADRLLGYDVDSVDALNTEIIQLLKNSNETELKLMLDVLRAIKANMIN